MVGRVTALHFQVLCNFSHSTMLYVQKDFSIGTGGGTCAEYSVTSARGKHRRYYCAGFSFLNTAAMTALEWRVLAAQTLPSGRYRGKYPCLKSVCAPLCLKAAPASATPGGRRMVRRMQKTRIRI